MNIELMRPFLFTGVLLFCFSVSCNRPVDKIRSAEKMIQHAESSTSQLPKSEIDELELKMNDLQSNLNQNRADFTDDQVKEIGKLQGRYTALLLKQGINNFKQSVKDFGNQMEGFIDGVTDSTNY